MLKIKTVFLEFEDVSFDYVENYVICKDAPSHIAICLNSGHMKVLAFYQVLFIYIMSLCYSG